MVSAEFDGLYRYFNLKSKFYESFDVRAFSLRFAALAARFSFNVFAAGVLPDLSFPFFSFDIFLIYGLVSIIKVLIMKRV